MKVTTFIVMADGHAAESRDVELGMFFDAEHAGAFIATLAGIWNNVRLVERQAHVDELHSAHHPIFLCTDCIKKKGRPDAASLLERPKGFKCLAKH